MDKVAIYVSHQHHRHLLVDLTAGQDVPPLGQSDQRVDRVRQLHLRLHRLRREVVVEVEDVRVVLEVRVRRDPHDSRACLHIWLQIIWGVLVKIAF